MKQDVLVDLDGVREGKRRSAELAEMAKEAADEVAGVSSLYAYYLQTHIGLSGVMQSVGTTPEMKAWRQRAIELEEEYMPGGPPMSPITDSYWESWLHYDMTVGPAHETLGGISLRVLRQLNPAHPALDAFAALNESRLGLYAVRGHERGEPVLEDLGSGWRGVVEVPSGRRGNSGAVWLTRLMPDPRDPSRAVSWTTPYEIVSPGEAELRRYLDRALPKGPRPEAYHRHMKRGPSPCYWHEYVFEGYAGHESSVVFLEGVPDKPETRPHSSQYAGSPGR